MMLSSHGFYTLIKRDVFALSVTSDTALTSLKGRASGVMCDGGMSLLFV